MTTRKFRLLQPLLLSFLMSAVLVSAASATEFTAEGYPAAFLGEQIPTEPLVLASDGYETTCETVEVLSDEVKSSSTTLRLTPFYSNCTAFGLSSATIDMNGCTYLLHLPEVGELATVDLTCPSGKEATITTSFFSVCVAHIPPFTGKSHVLVEDEGSTLSLRWTAGAISVSLTDANKFLCPFSGNTTVENATYTGSLTLSGMPAAEFTAASYPTKVAGEQTGPGSYVFRASSYETSCNQYESVGDFISQSPTLTLTSSTSECVMSGLKTTIKMNGCDYLFHSPPLAVVDLTCPVGQEVTTIAEGGVCVTHVPPFASKSYVKFTNGPGSTLETVAKVRGIKAELTDVGGEACPFSGNTIVQDATFVGNFTLSGSSAVDIG
jgi:hypothetical protein